MTTGDQAPSVEDVQDEEVLSPSEQEQEESSEGLSRRQRVAQERQEERERLEELESKFAESEAKNSINEFLDENKIPSAKRSEFKTQVDDLMDKGLSLDDAMSTSNQLISGNPTTGVKRKTGLPPESSSRATVVVSQADLANMNQDQYNETMNLVEAGKMQMTL